MTHDPVDAILETIRRLGDGPAPAPDERLVALLAERLAEHLPPPATTPAEPP